MRSENKIRFLSLALALCAGAAPRTARADENQRNPFWPVGYQPESIAPVEIVSPEATKDLSAAATALVEKGWKDALRRLDVRGSSRMADGRSLALINKRAYAVGEIVQLVHGGRPYAWKVVKIDLSGVTLERYNQNVAEMLEGSAESKSGPVSGDTEKGDQL
jgi:hypothetical protein